MLFLKRYKYVFSLAYIFAVFSVLVCTICADVALAQNVTQKKGISFSGRHVPIKFSTEFFWLDQKNKVPLMVLWLEPEKDHYTYANDPGDGGRPTKVQVTSAGKPLPQLEIVYPLGTQVADKYSDGKQVNVYSSKTGIIILPFGDSGHINADTPFDLDINLLVCAPNNCTPVKKSITSSLPLENAVSLKEAKGEAWWPDFDSAHAAAFSQNLNFKPRYDLEVLEVEGIGKAILLGFFAGFILNFMPCVFPVISLKLLALMLPVAQEKKRARIRAFRVHNIIFACGVIVWFMLLSTMLLALNMLWGQIFQSQTMVFALFVLMGLLTLSMFGLYTLPTLSWREGQGGALKSKSFLAGMLVTCLATPCSGPLLGGVLGWTFNQPQPVPAIVFLAVGLGMASPYIVLAMFPRVGRLFPRPGPWLLRLEVLVGFFLMLTVGYLFSLLSSNFKLPALLAFSLLATAAWKYGRYQAGKNTIKMIFHWRWFTAAALVSIIAVGALQGIFAYNQHKIWEPFSPQRFSELKGKRNVLLDFTADWCPSCKILERTVFTKKRMKEWQERYDAVFMQVDLTEENAAAYELLERMGSSSLPVVALFPVEGGVKSGEPMVIRDLFGPERLESAADEAWGSKESKGQNKGNATGVSRGISAGVSNDPR